MSNHDQELKWFLKSFLKVSLGRYQANFLIFTLAFLAQKEAFCVLEFGQNKGNSSAESTHGQPTLSLFCPHFQGLTNTHVGECNDGTEGFVTNGLT